MRGTGIGRQRPLKEKLDPARTALVVIGMQNDFCHADGFFGNRGRDMSAMPAVAGRISRLVEEARRLGTLILWVRAHYNDIVLGPPMGEAMNKPGSSSGCCQAGTFGADWYGDLQPRNVANELVVTKHRYSAFWDSPIDLYLRSNVIENLVVAGVSTDVCVESTVRDAFFRNYFVTVAGDATAAGPENHATALAAMGRYFADVVETDSVLGVWQNEKPPPAGTKREPGAGSGQDSETLLDPTQTALVIVDLLNDFCHPEGVMGASGDDLSQIRGAVLDTKALLEAARGCGALVVHVQTVNDPAARPARWRGLKSEAEEVSRLCAPGSWGGAIVDELTPLDGEEIVPKHRCSAFIDTRLETLLRSNGIRTLVVTGTTTQTCVESTVRDGQMRDYRVVVARDSVGARGHLRHLHDAALETMELYFADVTESAAVIGAWEAGHRNIAAQSAF